MTIPLKSFYFLRHGETDWNKNRIYMGQKDIPLNETGRKQANSVKELLKDKAIKHIITSPLARAYETAQIINKSLNLSVIELDELKECSFGSAEGKEHGDGTIINKWMNGEHPEGGEAKSEFETRIKLAFHKAIDFGDNTLIVSHGGVYICLARMMGWSIVNLQNCDLVFHKPPKKSNQPWLIDYLGGNL